MRTLLVAVFLLPALVTVPALAADAPATAPATSPAAAGLSPEAEALLNRVPRLSDQEPERASFDVTVTAGASLARSWIFRCVYRAPDERAVYVYHALDGTPTAIAAGGQVVVFDAVRGKVLRLQDYEMHFALAAGEGEKVTLNWGFDPRTQKKKGTVLDFRSLVDQTTVRVEPAPNGRQRLAGVSEKGGTVNALLDPSRPGHLVEFDLSTRDGRMGMVADRIAIDEPIDDRLFVAPDLTGFGERMEVVDKRVRVDSPEAIGRAAGEFWGAMMGRMAIHDPEFRQQMKGAFGQVDWQLAEAVDRIASPIVREVLGVAPGIHVSATRPAGAGANGGDNSNARPANKRVGSTHQ